MENCLCFILERRPWIKEPCVQVPPCHPQPAKDITRVGIPPRITALPSQQRTLCRESLLPPSPTRRLCVCEVVPSVVVAAVPLPSPINTVPLLLGREGKKGSSHGTLCWGGRWGAGKTLIKSTCLLSRGDFHTVPSAGMAGEILHATESRCSQFS